MSKIEIEDGVRVMPAYVTGGATIGIHVSRKAKSLGRVDEVELCHRVKNETDITVTPDGIQAVFNTVAKFLREGYDVSVADCCRFFTCLNRARTKLEVVAQTLGTFRESMADIPFTLSSGGQSVSERTLKARMTKKRKEQAVLVDEDADEVTPDQIVRCPKCGTRFRVGRRVAA